MSVSAMFRRAKNASLRQTHPPEQVDVARIRVKGPEKDFDLYVFHASRPLRQVRRVPGQDGNMQRLLHAAQFEVSANTIFAADTVVEYGSDVTMLSRKPERTTLNRRGH